MHIFSDSESYAQDIDGGNHHKPQGGSKPPKKVRERLKEKTGWDWDENEKYYNDIFFNTVQIDSDGNIVKREYNGNITPGIYFTPLFSPATFPAMSPFPMTIPVLP